MYSYIRFFDPKPAPAPDADAAEGGRRYAGDRRDGRVYVYDEEIVLAVNVALKTERPLLVRGPSGSGKSTLARNVARQTGRRYYEEVVSSRTQARDLLWRFDALRRLNDAQGHAVNPLPAYYVEPGLLWWAFDREGARRRGLRPEVFEAFGEAEREAFAARDPNLGDDSDDAVLLIDEIDKADPDTPNNLLVPLGSLQFYVEELKTVVKAARPPLVVITTNDERDLPAAFLRRCVTLELEAPTGDRLVEIAKAHFGEGEGALYEKVAALLAENAGGAAGDERPSSAEYLDAVRACLDLGVTPSPDDATWGALSKKALWKSGLRRGKA